MQTVLPQDLTAISAEEISELEASLLAEFDKAVDEGSNDVALLSEIADAVEAVRTESAARAEAEQARAEAISALAERVRPAQPEAEVVAEDPADDESEADTEAEEAEATTEERELVTASADKINKAPSARAVAQRSPQPAVENKPAPQVVITAAADIPGYSGGSQMDKISLAKAMHAKARTLANHSGYVPVAQIQKPIEHVMTDNVAHNIDVLEQATKPSALTAAGWCAPSQNLYSFLSIEGRNGLLDLPTVQITRGGINVPAYLDYSEATDALWSWTEEDPGTEATKPCLQIPCPEFTDYRLQADGLCLTNGNLTDRAFPELTARFVDLTLTAHLHRLSGLQVGAIVSSATGVTVGAINSSAAGSILHAIDLQVADYRSQYLMPVEAVLEAVFPTWVKELLRADLALRHGVELTNVSDDVVDAHFSVRKVRAQFVTDYRPLYSVAPATAFPTQIKFLLFPAGGYVLGDGGVIDLGIVRDSVLNATNDYTAAWTEQLWLVAQLGPKARQVTVNYAVDGITGECPCPEVAG